jgi:hypothetical protein
MADQKLQSELTRLRKQQDKARQDEVFGGLSHVERAEYEARANRINDVEIELQTKGGKPSSQSDLTAAEQKREWDKNSKTDTPQSKPRQTYRSREEDSANAFTDSLETGRGKRKNDPEKDSEKK